MGVVDLAAGVDGERVALKRVALAGSAEALAAARARIRREAEVLGQLDHPGIVPLLDVVDDGDDVVLVMPWLRGGSLADRGVMSPAEIEALADHLLPALAAAHRAGVVHRDVKPANVLFDDDSRPLLADFGVATARDATAGLTVGGLGPVGTAGFVAPEQVRGEPVGPAADVFSLGATLRWAATGVGPYGEGSSELLLWRAARGKVDRCPKTLPAALRHRIDAMLDPRAERRPSAAALAGGPDGTSPKLVVGRRRRRPWALVAAVPVALVGWLAVPTPASSAKQVVAVAPPCLPGHADYDGLEVNGCEAKPDTLDGAALDDELRPNLVPADDVDEFAVEVDDETQLLCDGELRLTLTAPPGSSVRLVVGDSEITSADGVPATVRLPEPSCGGDDGQVLTATVTPVGSDRSAAPYVLTRTGGW